MWDSQSCTSCKDVLMYLDRYKYMCIDIPNKVCDLVQLYAVMQVSVLFEHICTYLYLSVYTCAIVVVSFSCASFVLLLSLHPFSDQEVALCCLLQYYRYRANPLCYSNAPDL